MSILEGITSTQLVRRIFSLSPKRRKITGSLEGRDILIVSLEGRDILIVDWIYTNNYLNSQTEDISREMVGHEN